MNHGAIGRPQWQPRFGLPEQPVGIRRFVIGADK